jgi:hypothetical protein
VGEHVRLEGRLYGGEGDGTVVRANKEVRTAGRRLKEGSKGGVKVQGVDEDEQEEPSKAGWQKPGRNVPVAGAVLGLVV